jgi:hypothetical protein
MLVLEGNTIFDKGRPVGKLDLAEGQKSDRFCIVESCPGPLTEVATTDADLASCKTLMESEGGVQPKILLTLEGVFQRSDTKNANNRIYPESIWKRVFEGGSKWLHSVDDGDMIGEADHPKDGETLMQRAAGRVTKIWRNEDNPKEILGRFVVFNTARGRDLKAIHDGGGRLGVSSRGNGSVVRLEGKDIVQDDYDLQTWDVVYNPSTSGAYPKEVTEDKAKQGKSVQESIPVKKITGYDPNAKGVKVARNSHAVLETISALHVDNTKPLHETLADIRLAYRRVTDASGPLTEEESRAINLFVQQAYTGTVKIGTGPVSAKITWKSGVLGSSEIRAANLEELRTRITERFGSLAGVVEVEIDRSEEVIEECTKRFSSLLEAQTAKMALLEQRVLDAEEKSKKAVSDKTEISSKLAVAKELIEKFAARVKLAETKNNDLQGTADAAEKLIDAIADEFKEEGLRSVVAAIAATHPEVEGLAEALADVSSLNEAVSVTKREKGRHKTFFEREPIGVREERIQSALRKNLDEQQKIKKLQEYTKKSDSPVLTTTKTVVEALQERGLK